jgi:hypothetical protein
LALVDAPNKRDISTRKGEQKTLQNKEPTRRFDTNTNATLCSYWRVVPFAAVLRGLFEHHLVAPLSLNSIKLQPFWPVHHRSPANPFGQFVDPFRAPPWVLCLRESSSLTTRVVSDLDHLALVSLPSPSDRGN